MLLIVHARQAAPPARPRIGAPGPLQPACQVWPWPPGYGYASDSNAGRLAPGVRVAALAQLAGPPRPQQPVVGGAAGTVRVGNRPEVLLVVPDVGVGQRPVRVGQRPERHHPDPGRPVLAGEGEGFDDQVALPLLAGGVPGV